MYQWHNKRLQCYMYNVTNVFINDKEHKRVTTYLQFAQFVLRESQLPHEPGYCTLRTPEGALNSLVGTSVQRRAVLGPAAATYTLWTGT